MPVRFLSDAQREQLSGFPAELEPESLDRFFTLSGPDLAEVRRRHGDENRLGWSLQLCGLRMLGFCPDDVTTAPPSAVRFLARQLGVDPGVLDGYGSRAQTRTDHVNQVKAHLGFCSATNADLQDARDWLAAEALVQDRPVVLFRLVCERLHELRLVRPWVERDRAVPGRGGTRGGPPRDRCPCLAPVHARVVPGARRAFSSGSWAWWPARSPGHSSRVSDAARQRCA